MRLSIKVNNQKRWTSSMAANTTVYLAKTQTYATSMNVAWNQHSLDSNSFANTENPF